MESIHQVFQADLQEPQCVEESCTSAGMHHNMPDPGQIWTKFQNFPTIAHSVSESARRLTIPQYLMEHVILRLMLLEIQYTPNRCEKPFPSFFRLHLLQSSSQNFLKQLLTIPYTNRASIAFFVFFFEHLHTYLVPFTKAQIISTKYSQVQVAKVNFYNIPVVTETFFLIYYCCAVDRGRR